MRWHETAAGVRFYEVDSYGILWHGNYINYFEIGRLDFCKKFGLSVDRMNALGYFAPLIDLGCRFREPARYGDELIIRTGIDPTEKASLTFRYSLLRAADRRLLCEGHTTHILLTLTGKMIYMVPPELEKPLSEMHAFCNG